MRPLPLAVLFVLVAPPVFGGDGVLEINQACAAGPGCFGGDAAGFPVTIDGSAGRSYRLTGDLVVPDENTDGIELTEVSDVSIDLGGFRIVRAGCESSLTSCAPVTGTGSGIDSPNNLTEFGVSVRNGSIVGMGNYGVIVPARSHVSGIRTRWNRVGGVWAQRASIVEDCISTENGQDGFVILEDSRVSGNLAFLNGENGINGTTGSSTFTGNTLRSNGHGGLWAGARSTISGNTASFNGQALANSGWGIRSDSGSLVSENTASNNIGFGIWAGADSLVQGNTIQGNTLTGLVSNTGTGYRENMIRNNAVTVSGGGTDLGGNLCDASTTCP